MRSHEMTPWRSLNSMSVARLGIPGEKITIPETVLRSIGTDCSLVSSSGIKVNYRR